jgi:hypothetical protein
MILRKEICSSNDSNFRDKEDKSHNSPRVVSFSYFDKEKKMKASKRRINAAAENLAW